eukprot:363475-Chlamydomonas_euryale.AAC.4
MSTHTTISSSRSASMPSTGGAVDTAGECDSDAGLGSTYCLEELESLLDASMLLEELEPPVGANAHVTVGHTSATFRAGPSCLRRAEGSAGGGTAVPAASRPGACPPTSDGSAAPSSVRHLWLRSPRFVLPSDDVSLACTVSAQLAAGLAAVPADAVAAHRLSLEAVCNGRGVPVALVPERLSMNGGAAVRGAPSAAARDAAACAPAKLQLDLSDAPPGLLLLKAGWGLPCRIRLGLWVLPCRRGGSVEVSGVSFSRQVWVCLVACGWQRERVGVPVCWGRLCVGLTVGECFGEGINLRSKLM